MSLLEGVLISADKITPVEYGILTQVEAATLLWQIDQERALTMLKSASETMRELKEKDPDKSINSKQRRLRFLAFLKIARLKPDLVKELALTKSNDDKGVQPMSGDWTEEARAVMTIAVEQIEKNPTLAAQLAKQTFSIGQVDWAVFLRMLSARDSRLSEQLATAVIDQLRNGSLTPIYLLNLRRFVLTPERSAQLKDHYFQSLAVRLRQDIGPAVPSDEVSSNLSTTQAVLRMAADYPRWRAEFEAIDLASEELLKARSAAVPVTGRGQTIRISMSDEIKPGDTQEIVEAVPRVERIGESKARDLKYQEMATKAAFKSDLRLAEDLISKIEDEGIRCDTTMSVYGPFVRKAISESDWTRAREHASKIIDPLGRTLVLDRIAQAMSQSRKDKQSVKDMYSFARQRLQRETPTEDVAKAFLIISKSLSTIEAEESLDSVSWAIYILNRVARNGELLGEFKVSGALAPWVRVSTFSLHDEVLDLTEMIGPFFKDLAKRESNTAQLVAYGFAHQGLYSLAQLGIVRGLLEKAEEGKAARPGQQTSGKTAQ